MKVALVLSPNLFKRCPLIGYAYLFAYLKERDIEVSIFDLNTKMDIPNDDNERDWANPSFVDQFMFEHNHLFDSFVEEILQSQAKIIGFSIWTTTKFSSLILASMIKRKDKDRLIVFGGPECSFFAKEFIQDEAIDIVVRGEGEQTLLELVQKYERGGRIDFCPGSLLKRNGEIIDGGFREEISNLDALPFPDFSNFPLKKYYLRNSLPIMFNRGCTRKCVFCNAEITWRKWRFRSAKNIYQEMIFQLNNYPKLEKFEVDDTALNLNLMVLLELSELMIKDNTKINWGGAAIIHPKMDYELLEKMARAGCNSLAYGLESGSQKVIDKMGKGFKIEDAERVIQATHRAGIEAIINIVIGFPGETEEDFEQTMQFIERNRRYIYFVSYPSECYIGNRTYLHTHPDEFDVELVNGGDSWQTNDRVNTHQARKERIKIFNDFVSSLDLSLHNYATTIKGSKSL